MKKTKYSWKQCIANYRFHSIFIKNLLLLFLLILLPFICILSLSFYSYRHIQSNEEKIYKEEMNARISKDVENVFREIRNKAIMLGSDLNMETFFRAESIEQDFFYDARSILQSLALYKRSSNVIDSIYVYADYSDVVISELGRFPYEGFDDQECIDVWNDSDNMFQVKYLNRKVAGKKKETIAFYYRPDYGGERKGAVIINISLDKLKKQLVSIDGVSTFIVKDEQLLYDSTMKRNGITLDDPELFFADTEEYVSSVIGLDLCDLEVVVRVDRLPLAQKLQSLLIYISIFVSIVLVFSVLFAFYISRKIFDPFSEIMKVLEDKPETDNQNLLQNQDEVKYIKNAIYATLARNKNIEEELVERIQLLKKAQSIALQSQINPHFINNTLDSVNWMVIKHLGEKNQVSEMLTSLSCLMRVSLQSSDTFVTLQEEIDYVKDYLCIQKHRLGDSFDVIYDNLDEFKEYKVIKMILQPIIENAIEYGIKPYAKRGKIIISAQKNENVFQIIVQDSGIGVSQGKLEEINQSIRDNTIKEDEHIGLCNVNQRVRLVFGDIYGLAVESQIGFGTRVILNLPYF